MNNTVTPATGGRPYERIAAELHRIAADLNTIGQPAPAYFHVGVQPCEGDTAAETVARIDEVATVLLGCCGATHRLPGGHYHHTATGLRGSVAVSIYQRVPGPPDERDAELERLRAELAELRGYSRDVDNGDPAAPIPDGVYGEHEGAGPSRADIHGGA